MTKKWSEIKRELKYTMGFSLNENGELVHKCSDRFPGRIVCVRFGKRTYCPHCETNFKLELVNEVPVLQEEENVTG